MVNETIMRYPIADYLGGRTEDESEHAFELLGA